MNHVNLSLATKSDTAVVTVSAGDVTRQYQVSLKLLSPLISLCPATSPDGFGIMGMSLSEYGVNFIVSPQKSGAFGLSVYDIVGRKIWDYQGKAAGGVVHPVAWEPGDSGTHSRIQGVYYVVFRNGNKERLQRFLSIR